MSQQSEEENSHMFDGEDEENQHANENGFERVEVREEEEMKTMEYVIGIDLGTTNSCVGLWKPEE